jgi:YihY family inner membrane protein
MELDKLMDFQKVSTDIQDRLDQYTGGVSTIIIDSVQSFAAGRGAEAAASLAYYALFSIFPLLLFVVGFVSSFLSDEMVQDTIQTFIQPSVPEMFQDLIMGNIEQAIAARGSVQILGTIGLLWAATGVFSGLTRNLDRAWGIRADRHFILGRLIGLGMIGALTIGLVVLWVVSTTMLKLLPLITIPLIGNGTGLTHSSLWMIASRLLPWLLIMFALFNIYRWVPKTTVKAKEALWAALVASAGWELAQLGFGWYLTSGWAKYQLVYGSLGAVIAFMLWLYVSSMVVLYGAYLSAAIARRTRPKSMPEELSV